MNNLKNKLWRLYTGDYTDVGYHIGETQAKQGKPKSFFGLLTNIHWVNHIWQARQAQSSLSQGIKKGYDNQLFAQTMQSQFARTPQPSDTTGATMSNLENYNRILSGLETAKHNIELNINQLSSSLAHYDRQIEAMKDVGFLDDYTKQLRSYNGLKIRIDGLNGVLEEFLKKIEDIKKSIEILKADADK